MAFVAIVAGVVGATVLKNRRSQSLAELADYHNAASHQLEIEGRFFICGFGMSPERSEEFACERAAETKLLAVAAEYHRLLSSKYQSAAARPWYPVSSDPPPPALANPKIVTADDY